MSSKWDLSTLFHATTGRVQVGALGGGAWSEQVSVDFSHSEAQTAALAHKFICCQTQTSLADEHKYNQAVQTRRGEDGGLDWGRAHAQWTQSFITVTVIVVILCRKQGRGERGEIKHHLFKLRTRQRATGVADKHVKTTERKRFRNPPLVFNHNQLTCRASWMFPL